MTASPCLDYSAVLRAVLEAGTTPGLEARLASAPVLVTSRLSLAECARVLIHLARRRLGDLELVTVDERLKKAAEGV